MAEMGEAVQRSSAYRPHVSQCCVVEPTSNSQRC